jgi:putative solute:sodium symporter small subunit
MSFTIVSVFKVGPWLVRNRVINIHMVNSKGALERYWKANIRIVVGLLLLWFSVSFGCGILLRDWLDAHFPSVGSAPFGFWMAQQGSILCFVGILILYAKLMAKLDYQIQSEGGTER